MARTLLILAIFVITGCASGSGPSGEASPSPSSAGSTGPAVSAEPGPDATAPASASGPTTATISDPAGDVEDPDGNPPPAGGSSADLIAVTLYRDHDGLTVRFDVAAPVPASADSLLWSVELGDGPDLTVGAQLTGGELNAGVYDHGRDVQHALEDVEVHGATITVDVPEAELEQLGRTFDWSALTQLDGAYEDRTGTAAFPEVAE